MVINNNIKYIAITEHASKAAQPTEVEGKTKGNGTLPAKVSKENNALNLNKIKERAMDALKIEQYMNRAVRLEVENDLHIIVVKIIDKESGDVIRQIPVDELIKLSKNIKEQLSKRFEEHGLLVDKEI